MNTCSLIIALLFITTSYTTFGMYAQNGALQQPQQHISDYNYNQPTFGMYSWDSTTQCPQYPQQQFFSYGAQQLPLTQPFMQQEPSQLQNSQYEPLSRNDRETRKLFIKEHTLALEQAKFCCHLLSLSKSNNKISKESYDHAALYLQYWSSNLVINGCTLTELKATDQKK